MQALSSLTISQILICCSLAIALIAAVIAFIKTPTSERFLIRKNIKELGAEYAPMYTAKEKVRIILKHALWVVPLYIFMEYWFFPHLNNYAPIAHCYNYGSINGSHLIFYGVFVGLPLSIAIFFFIFEGSNAIKALKLGQYPLPNKKVFGLTKYKYGNLAKLHALLFFVIMLYCLCVSVWGGFQAYKLTEHIPPCTANKPLKDAP